MKESCILLTLRCNILSLQKSVSALELISKDLTTYFSCSEILIREVIFFSTLPLKKLLMQLTLENQLALTSDEKMLQLKINMY